MNAVHRLEERIGLQPVREYIDPARAKALLEINKSNRKLKDWYVTTLAGAMTRGEWRETHQAIAITADNVLLDGQHRLHAIVASGVPQFMFIFYGCADNYGCVDVGRPRTIADHFRHERPEFTQPAAFLARLAYGPHATLSQVRAVHAKIETEAALIAACTVTRRRGISSASVRAAAVLQMVRGHNEDYILRLYKLIVTVQTQSPEMPPIGHAFIRQCMGLTGHATATNTPHDLFCRALTLFNEKNASMGRLQIKDVSIHVADARADVVKLVGRNSPSA